MLKTKRKVTAMAAPPANPNADLDAAATAMLQSGAASTD